ncbi:MULTISPECIES: hypothetical protein [Bacillus cereus group]|uniref:Uncharacterized protein n=1 Tax=Bacillus cereus VD048 TaxID=1053226 RepID=J8HNK4_BACCE|nr:MULTISPECIES: hypothetical protein [Bacillus cereus group]EJR26736.1 hypothetical protein IIG_05293 [Bacillus cereus VD048]EJR26932.1 hypothetical protein IIG_05062 [Bacillus cereus VD048]
MIELQKIEEFNDEQKKFILYSIISYINVYSKVATKEQLEFIEDLFQLIKEDMQTIISN